MNLIDRDAVIDKLVYTASNAVADHLVDRVHHWPEVNGLAALLAARPLRATSPLHFCRPDGSMPDALELPLTLPTELGPGETVRSELRKRPLGPASSLLEAPGIALRTRTPYGSGPEVGLMRELRGDPRGSPWRPCCRRPDAGRVAFGELIARRP